MVFNPFGVNLQQHIDRTLGPDSTYASKFLALKRPNLLAPAEVCALSIFKMLSVTRELLICPQVHVLQLFEFDEKGFIDHVGAMAAARRVLPEYLPRTAKLVKEWSTKRAYRSVDFLFCDPTTTRVLFAVEIDDPSHQDPARKDADEIKDMMFASTEIPLYRFTNAQIHSVSSQLETAWEAGFMVLFEAAADAWAARSAFFIRAS
jgi:hypothetical protein